jgi:hypothetical protein
MFFPPFFDFRRNAALAYDYIINRKVNGKMTGTLQIGNVWRVLTLCFQDWEGKDFGRVMVKVLP